MCYYLNTPPKGGFTMPIIHKEKVCKECGIIFRTNSYFLCGNYKNKTGCAYKKELIRVNGWMKGHGNKSNGKSFKELVFSHYSKGLPLCNCCGVVGLEFLSIDHINDDGAKIRGKKQTFTGSSFYRWIIKNNYPNDLQVLCYNCNNAKHWNNNTCPHKTKYANINTSESKS